jgi:hypothetical protein
MLDHVLETKNGGQFAVIEVLVSLRFGVANVGNDHLNVSVATEAALFGHLRDVAGRRAAVVGSIDAWIHVGECVEDWYEIRCLICNCDDFDDFPVVADRVSNGHFGSLLEHLAEPCRHLVFVCMGAEFGALEVLLVADIHQKDTTYTQSPSLLRRTAGRL